MIMTDKTLYQFNYSQDIVHLQTVYSLFNRVSNIIFSVTFDEGFDESLMSNAIQLLMERNDCLRLKFVKEGKVTKQYFETERSIGKIPSLTFRTNCQMYSFIRKFRRKAIDVRKGETMNVVFATDPTGNKMLIIKISHMVADTYGIGILVNDLNAIYQALKNRTALPAAPGHSKISSATTPDTGQTMPPSRRTGLSSWNIIRKDIPTGQTTVVSTETPATTGSN